MLRKIYLSPLGYLVSFVLNWVSIIHKPFMVYGYLNKKDKKFQKHTRISSSAKLINKKNINIANNVWVGHYCLIDGIGGVEIEEGVHLASHSVIYSHSSQNSIRLLGKSYINIPEEDRVGYIFKKVKIGKYTFVGTSCVILAGTVLGQGCIVGAGSIVSGKFPDYSIIVGNPAKVVGDTRKVDEKYFNNVLIKKTYYDKRIINDLSENNNENTIP